MFCCLQSTCSLCLCTHGCFTQDLTGWFCGQCTCGYYKTKMWMSGRLLHQLWRKYSTMYNHRTKVLRSEQLYHLFIRLHPWRTGTCECGKISIFQTCMQWLLSCLFGRETICDTKMFVQCCKNLTGNLAVFVKGSGAQWASVLAIWERDLSKTTWDQICFAPTPSPSKENLHVYMKIYHSSGIPVQ